MLSKNIKETEKIAKSILIKLSENKKRSKASVVGLCGDLGAGKTALTKLIAKHLGVKKRVFSPTFVIMKKYPIKTGNYKYLYHLDAYRLKDGKELLCLGWEEIIKNKEHLIFIEWPENVISVMPSDSKYIHISINKDGHRNLKFK